MNVVVLTPPAAEPVTLDDARLWVRASGNVEDLLLTMLIAAARARAEHLTQRAFVQRTVQVQLEDFSSIQTTVQVDKPFGWDYDLWVNSDLFGCNTFTLPIEPALLPAPIIAVSALKYLDAAAVEQTVDPVNYTLFPGSEMAIRFAPGFVLPITALNRPDAVRIELTVGYPPKGSDPAGNVPPEVKQWMRMNISTWYTNREAIVAGKIESVPTSVFEGLLDGLILARRFA